MKTPFTVHRSPFTVHRSPFTVHRLPFTRLRCLLVLIYCSSAMSVLFAQKIDLPFPTPREPIYTEEDSATGLWQNKYAVKVDSQSFYLYDLEIASSIHSGEERCLNKNCTPDIIVYHYQPILDGRVERTEEELLPPRLPTIFVIPGGGFFLPIADALRLTSKEDSCSPELGTMLASLGYNAFVVYYEVDSTNTDILCLFDVLDLNPNSTCPPSNYAKYKHEAASIRSFWSLRNILRTQYFDNAATLAIDTNKMVIAGHSAGAVLSIYYTFLNSSEIPSTICTGDPSCTINEDYRTQYFNLPRFRGVLAMAGATFYPNIFDNDIAAVNAFGTKIQFMHGSCDELINEYIGHIPWRRNMPQRTQFTHGVSMADKYHKVYGSSYIFKNLLGKVNKVKFEESCVAGHDIHKMDFYNLYCDYGNWNINHGAWNFCDKKKPPTAPAPINDQQYIYEKIKDFSNRVLFNSPAPFVSEFKSFTPELAYCDCPDTTDICMPTQILYTYKDNDCNKRALVAQADDCLRKGVLFFWRFKTLPSGAWSAYTATAYPEFDLSAVAPNNANIVVDMVAINACDTIIKRDTFNFCNLCSCNPNRMAQTTEVQHELTLDEQRDLIVESSIAGDAQITITDTKGSIIATWKDAYQVGKNYITLTALKTDLPSGIYLITSTINGNQQTLPFFKP